MPAPRSHRRARLAALVSVVLAVTGFQFFLAPPRAKAAAPDLSSARCTAGVETPVPVQPTISSSCTTPGLTDQRRRLERPRAIGRHRAAASGADIPPLTGTVPAGGYYLIQEAVVTGAGVALPTPNATGDNRDGRRRLAGFAGNTTTGLDPADGNVRHPVRRSSTSSVLQRLQLVRDGDGHRGADDTTRTTRNASGTDTDNNAADFSTRGAPPTAAAPAALSLTNPGPQTGTVGVAISTLQLAASGGTSPYTYGATVCPPA